MSGTKDRQNHGNQTSLADTVVHEETDPLTDSHTDSLRTLARHGNWPEERFQELMWMVRVNKILNPSEQPDAPKAQRSGNKLDRLAS